MKKTFLSLLGILSILLIILPFLVAFNEGLTKIVESTFIYRGIQKTIVPFEVKIVASILYLAHIPVIYQSNGLTINGTFLKVTWNCLGWQSMLFLLLSLIVGLQGKFKKLSIVETVLTAILGTFILNITRITLVSLIGAYLPSVFAIVFHDYLAAFITLVWLFFFWWFSYGFVLEEK